MNWIPTIIAAGNGDIHNPKARQIARQFWERSLNGRYIVDHAYYMVTVKNLCDFLNTDMTSLRLKMIHADKEGKREIMIDQHNVRFNTYEGHHTFL